MISSIATKAVNDSGKTGEVTGDHGATRRLRRSRSAEDLSREQLKNTESDTVLIFLEYVRKKLDNTSPRAVEVDEAIEKERRQRRERPTKRTFLRRLQSEPHSPVKNGEREKKSGKLPQHDEQGVAGHEAGERSSRPHRLVLERPPSNKDERRHRLSAKTKKSTSNSSSTATTPCGGESYAGLSSDATTPVSIPDPPLCVGLSSPCDAGADFVSSYPPPSAHRLRTASSPVIGPVAPVIVGVPISQQHYCTSQQPLTPNLTRSSTSRDSKWNGKKQARIIANKLKIFGDEISSAHEAEIQREFADLITTQSPQEVIAFLSSQLRHMLLGLSWQNIGKVFHLSYHLMESLTMLLGPSVEDTTGRPEWREFSELWDLTLGSVTRWISSNGGWRAFPADASTAPSPSSSNQATCPATPSFQRARNHLMSLSESGEFEFFNEEGHPHSADTVSTTSSEMGWGEDGEDRMGSSVDLQHDHLEESTSESSLTTSPPYPSATLTPITVAPPCTLPTTTPCTPPTTTPRQNNTNPSPKISSKRVHTTSSRCRLKESHSVPNCGGTSSTVAFRNGIPELAPQQSSHEKSQPKRKSRSVTERPAKNGVNSKDGPSVVEGHLNCIVNPPRNTARGSGSGHQGSGSGHRTSQTAFNGLVFGVGGAAVVYAAVSALMRR